LSKEESVEFLTETFGASTAQNLSNAVWKARLEGVTSILEGLDGLDLAANGAKCVQALCHLPGWKDVNFQVCLLYASYLSFPEIYDVAVALQVRAIFLPQQVCSAVTNVLIFTDNSNISSIE
jgi:hypothetical protein